MAKITEYKPQHEQLITLLWEKNKYQIQSGLDYINYISHIHGRLTITMFLFAINYIFNLLLTYFFKEYFSQNPYHASIILFVAGGTFLFQVIPRMLKKEVDVRLEQDLISLSKNSQSTKTRNFLVALENEKKAIGTVDAMTYEEYQKQELVEQGQKTTQQHVSKVVGTLPHTKNDQILVLQNMCVDNKLEYDQMKKTIHFLVENQCDFLSKLNKKSKDVLNLVITVNTMNRDMYKLLKEEKFEDCSNFYLSQQENVYGAVTCIMKKQL